MKKINFLMGLHCHQPVDNLETIFEEAYRKSYSPFLDVLEAHPGVKLSVHYSGSLLDWLAVKKPAFIQKIKGLVERHQIEILTGGHFEPILPMIPPEDAKGQIRMLTRSIKKYFECRPSGAWIGERVWDPALASILRDMQLKYTILDDFHLTKAGKRKDDVFGYYSVKGFPDFYVFPSIKRLRYTMPFREPEVTIDFLYGLKEKNADLAVFGDDCEKFGLWPYTYGWVYKKGWLDKFFTALEKNDWIKTLTFSEAINETMPLGEVEIPHSSYAEMSEWCNGNFNNFFTKYAESDLMKNKMLYLSKKIEKLQHEKNVKTEMPKIEKARKELYKSQSNCAYWHGIFGGVYINFLRQGIYTHLIKSESALLDDQNKAEIQTIRFSSPAGEKNRGEKKIICARNKFLNLFVDPDYAGSLFEIDYKPLSYNLVNTISRRYEPYHEKLKKRQGADVAAIKKAVDEDGHVNLYDVLGVREKNLDRFLAYDRYKRFSFLCHVLDEKISLDDFVQAKHVDPGHEGLFGSYGHNVKDEKEGLLLRLERDCTLTIGGERHLLKLTKSIILRQDSEISVKCEIKNMSPKTANGVFGMEFNWSVEDPSFMRGKRAKRSRQITLKDRSCGLRIDHVFEEPVNVWSFPVYTLNESERGLGKTFQEVSLLFCKKISLENHGKFSLQAKIKVSG